MRFVKPLDEDILNEVLTGSGRVVTVEDGCRDGGMGSAVAEWLTEHGYRGRITRLGIPDRFIDQGTPAELHHLIGIDKEGIKKELTST